MRSLFLILSIGLGLLCISACKQPDPEPNPEPQKTFRDIDVVTGIDYLDLNATPIGRWRQPNRNADSLATFPNPTTGLISILRTSSVKTLYLIPAECLLVINENIPTLSQSLAYETTDVEAVMSQSIANSSGAVQLSLDLSNEAPGFYRLFFEMEDGTFLWENIFLEEGGNSGIPEPMLEKFCE